MNNANNKPAPASTAAASAALDEVGLPLSFANLRFEYETTHRNLTAVLYEGETPQDLSFAGLQARITAEGYQGYGVTGATLSDLSLKAQHGKWGSYVVGKKPLFTHVSFHLDNHSGTLYADLKASEEEQLVNRAWLQDQLNHLGYAEFHYEPHALDKLFQQFSKHQHGRVIVGERRDARVSISCDDHLMSAHLSVRPPAGGRELDQALLDQAIERAGVLPEYCDQSVLQRVLASKQADNLRFASGCEPVNGSDTRFEALVEEVIYRTPKESKSGKIDLRELLDFTEVEIGTPLMRRIPATKGVNGHNIKGQVIPAADGAEIPFNADLNGAEPSPDDDNLLLATAHGHPLLLPDGVRVDQTIVVNNVDMSTGNITYDGSLMVKGEVKPGMVVKVTGDIVVAGVVSKASLYAKNNIDIRCGVIGSDPSKDGAESPPAILRAGGDIRAQYVNLASLHAGNNIDVKEYISHCECEAKRQILVGQRGGKGRIFGGTCSAKEGISANAVGAEGAVKTLLHVGASNVELRHYEELLSSHENRKKQCLQLREAKARYRQAVAANPTDIAKLNKFKAIQKVLADLESEIAKVTATINQIDRLFAKSLLANITVLKATFANVTLIINGAEFHLRQAGKGGIFTKEGDDIRWNNSY